MKDKLQKQRVYKCTEKKHWAHDAVIPDKPIKEQGWKSGQELELIVNKGKLISELRSGKGPEESFIGSNQLDVVSKGTTTISAENLSKTKSSKIDDTRERRLSLKKGKLSHPSGRLNALNDFTGSEWAQSSRSVMEYPDTRSKKQRFHGAAFPQSLAEHQILIYTKKGETVLDPFVGVGTTLDAAAATQRNGIGIELNPEFVRLAKEEFNDKRLENSQRIILDDARNLKKHVKPESVNFVLTSPPYANMLNKIQKNFLYKWKTARKRFGFKPIENARPYSSDPKDIGNLSYQECLNTLEKVLKDTFDVIKPESYAAWVVKDYRDLKKGIPYVNFHCDLITRAEKAGWVLWDIRIFDQTKFRPLIVLGIPSRNFYLNIGHSFILVFKKTDKTRKE